MLQLNHFIITMLEFVSAFSIASRRGFKKHGSAHLSVILVTFIHILFYFARGFPNRQAFSLKSCITYGVRNCDLLVLWKLQNILYFFFKKKNH